MARHVFPLQPRWSDLDAYNHVNNVTWLEYLQEARVDMLFVHAPQRGAEALAEGVVVVRAEIDYRRPMVFRQHPYSVEMWVSELRVASFTIRYEIKDDGGSGSTPIYGTAATILTPVNLASGRPRRLSPLEREVLGRFT